MKTGLHAAFVLAAAWLLAGCYESEVPLAAAPSGPLDARLFGQWKGEGDDEAADRLLILKFDDRQGYAELRESQDQDPGRFRIYAVTVGGVAFLDVQEVPAGTGEHEKHIFFRYEFAGDGSLSFRMVSDRLIKTRLTSSRALYEFIRRHLNEEELYEEPTRFTRVAES